MLHDKEDMEEVNFMWTQWYRGSHFDSLPSTHNNQHQQEEIDLAKTTSNLDVSLKK
jgi:hypothetical protein